MAITSRPRRRRAPRRKAMRKSAPRRMRIKRNQPEWATLSETIDYGNENVGTVYNNNDIQLAGFPRASAVAQGYQYFRITRLTFKYKPLLDTFASTGNTQVPYLYWVINKNGTEYPVLTTPWFLANGAKPIRFDDKTVTISYAPAVSYSMLEANTPSATQEPNQAKILQWLNTTKDAFLNQPFAASQVSHAGHYLMVTSPGSTVPMSYEVTLTAEFQFKKPNAPLPSSGISVVQKSVDRN